MSLRIGLIIVCLGALAGLAVSFISAPVETIIFTVIFGLIIGLFFYGRLKSGGWLDKQENDQQKNSKFY